MFSNTSVSFVALASLVLPMAANGAVITLADFDFNDNNATVDTKPTEVSVTNLSFNSYEGPNSISSGIAIFRDEPSSNSLANAIDAGAYTSFTLDTIDPAKALTFSSISVKIRGAGTAIPNFVLQWNPTGTFETIKTLTGITNTSTFTVVTDEPISGSNISAPVTFRFVSHNSVGTGVMRGAIDDVVIKGEVVPEPAAIGIIGMAGAALLARRRRVA